MATRVIVNGALGKMGQEVIKTIEKEPSFEIVGKSDKNDDLKSMIAKTKAQIVVDFTHPSVGFQNSKTIIEANAHPVIGTTGFTPEQISELQKLCAQKKLGGLIAPNFSLGAVLMMKYAQEIAKYYAHAEIIELHHDAKADFPSGTAIKTAEMIAEVKPKSEIKITEKAVIPGARGANHHEIPIHSVRLPGIVANQEVIFGGLGETLKICHHTINREAFMPGVILACKKVIQLNELVYGLDKIL